MPYTKEHKERSRERILQSAGRLFSRRGFEAVSIDDLMHDAGMTRGAFYNHFTDKAEVYAAAIVHATRNSPLATDTGGNPPSTAIHALLDRYLSREHLEQADPPCPLAFLVTDVGTREAKVRAAYTDAYKGLVKVISKYLERAEDNKKAEAVLAVTALMIGGVAVGRALDCPTTTDDLLRSCRNLAMHILKG